MHKLNAHSALETAAGQGQRAHHTAGNVVIEEVQVGGMIRLQGDGSDAAFCAAAQSVLGLALPGPGETAQGNDITLYWLTPDEWLIVCTAEQEAELVQALLSLTSPKGCRATAMADSRVVVHAYGSGVLDLLAQGCTLDFNSPLLAPGRCAVTRFAQVPTLIRRETEQHFELMVDRSVALYVWDWLVESLRDQRL